jgi:hypothetical protein
MADDRPFRVISHKPGILKTFEPFGGKPDIGVSVESGTGSHDLWWMAHDWAIQVLKAGIALPQLTSPTPGFVASLDERWRNREVGTLLKRDIPRFFEQKGTDYRLKHHQVVVSIPAEHTELMPPEVALSVDLADGELGRFASLPGDILLQLDQMLACVVEVRCWIADKELTGSAAYRLGMVSWDSSLFLEMMLNDEGRKLADTGIEFAQKMAADTDGPPGYAVDIGVTLDGTATVLRAWPSWAADPLHAEPAGVFRSLVAAHDFDGLHTPWRWNPDRRVYDRNSSPYTAPAPEAENPNPEGVPQ